MEYREHFVLYGHIITIQCLDFNRLGESQNGMTVFAVIPLFSSLSYCSVISMLLPFRRL